MANVLSFSLHLCKEKKKILFLKNLALFNLKEKK